MVTLKEAKEVTDVIVKAIRPSSVILFGSVAREGAGEDLDLLIITEKIKKTDQITLYKALRRFYRKFSIDPFLLTAKKLTEYYRHGSPFVRMLFKEGRLLYMKDPSEQWFKDAEEEFAMAEYLFKGDFYRGSCYHSQQALEKALKASLLKKGWQLEKTHSIQRLMAIAKDHRIRIELSDEEIIFMDSIYRGRYPAEAGLLPHGEPSQEDARKALQIVKRVLRASKPKR